MIATIAVIAASAAKKKTFSDHSDHIKPLFSDRCRCYRWRVVSI